MAENFEKLHEDIIKFLGGFVSRSVICDKFIDMFLERHPNYSNYDALTRMGDLVRLGYVYVREDEKINKPVYYLTAKALQEFSQFIKPVEETKYSILLNGVSFLKIHPALAFANNTLYLGMFLPCHNVEKNNETEALCILTSKKELYPITSEGLKERKMQLLVKPVKFESRMSIAAIKNFINGSVNLEPKEVFDNIKNLFKTYIEFSDEEAYDFFSLWVIGTYLHPLFKAYPYVYIGGMKETGKTKVLNVLSCLCFNAIFSGNMSVSSIFRLIQNARCTLLIDETEKLANPERAQEFRNILLNGYKQGTKVYRSEKNARDRFEVTEFEPYSPKAVVNIRGLEDVLDPRCINFMMQRTINKEIGNKEVDSYNEQWQIARDEIYFLVLLYWDSVKEIYCNLANETNLSNREWELWKPILSIAKFVDEGLYKNLISFVEKKAEEKHVENITETGEYILVETLLDVVREDAYYKVKEIREFMANKFDDDNQKWLDNRWIGRALQRLGFLEKRRVGSGIEYRLTPSSIKNLANRLQITPSQTPQITQTTEDSEVNAVSVNKNTSEVTEKSEENVVVNRQRFTFLPNSNIGTCSYCGRVREVLFWKDSRGNWLCEECKISEEMR